MANPLPYDTSAAALLRPAENAIFFAGWDPPVDNRNHDLLCAEMSRLAYADPKVVPDALGPSGFSVVGFIDFKGTEGFVASNPEQELTVLAFRGTESKFEDLISDLDTFQAEFREGSRVHAGFLKAYSPAVQQQIGSLLQERAGNLLITGHSLGAAMATLAAIDLKPAALITFGSPRVGDAQFSRFFAHLNARRFVNCCDVVARIPPERFDRQHLLQLLTEFGSREQFTLLGVSLEKAAAEVTASTLAAIFRQLTPEIQFTHISPSRYFRADGSFAGEISDQEILQDQQKARERYGNPSATLRKQMQELIQTLAAPSAQSLAHLGQLPRSFVRGLFNLIRGDPVPFRDLADHAPINYVSAFTGRTA